MQEEHIFGTTCKLPCSYAREQVIRCCSCKYGHELVEGAYECDGPLTGDDGSCVVPPDGFCFCAEPRGASRVCQNDGKGAAAQALQPLLKEPGDIGGTPLLELGA